jgi:hypothetical protein
MARESLLVTQGGADTFTAGSIATGLTVDGKSGWSISGFDAFWVDGKGVAAADYLVAAQVATVATATTYGEDDEIGRLTWGLQNTGGVAVAVGYEPIKSLLLLEPRVTVQPEIYVQVYSEGTSNANDIIFIVYYEIVKLSDIEVLRLLAGGA